MNAATSLSVILRLDLGQCRRVAKRYIGVDLMLRCRLFSLSLFLSLSINRLAASLMSLARSEYRPFGGLNKMYARPRACFTAVQRAPTITRSILLMRARLPFSLSPPLPLVDTKTESRLFLTPRERRTSRRDSTLGDTRGRYRCRDNERCTSVKRPDGIPRK